MQEEIRRAVPEIADIYNKESAKQRAFMLGLITSNIEREEISRAIDEANALPASGRRLEILSELFRKWGESDHDGALKYTDRFPNREREPLITAALSGWILTDSVTAWEWSKANPPDTENNVVEPFPGRALSARVAALADALSDNGRSGQALALASTLEESGAKFVTIMRLVTDMAKYDLLGVTSWVSGLPSGGTRQNALGALGQALALESPDFASVLTAALQDPKDQISAMSIVTKTWAQMGATTEPLAWLAQQPSGAVRDTVASSYIYATAARSLPTALEVLGEYVAGEKRDSVVASIMKALAKTSPAKALEWIAAADKSERRSARIVEIVQGASARDRADLSSGLATMSFLTSSDRASLVSALDQLR